MTPNQLEATRTGKIARLPRLVREQLNRRLADGEPGETLLAWLNGHEEVQGVLARLFGGRPVTKQNLSEWRQGGFRDWERRAEVRDSVRGLAEEADEFNEDLQGGSLSDRLATVLTAQLAIQTQALLASTEDPQERAGHLRAALDELRHLRQQDHEERRVRLKEQRWDSETEAAEQAAHLAELKAMREKSIAPLWAMFRLDSVAALFGGGEFGRRAAAMILETEYDLKPGTLQGKPRPAPTRPTGSDPVQPSPTQSDREGRE